MGRSLVPLTVALALTLSQAAQVSAQVRRQPYLQIVTSTGVVVRWDTDSTVAGTVHYGTSVNTLADSAMEPMARSNHEVLLTGLSPRQKYYYSVTGPTGGSEGQYVITAPEPGNAASTRIWVVSDFGQDPTIDGDARRLQTIDVWKGFNANSLHADFMLSLGDQTEIDTDTQLQQNYFNTLQDVLRVTPLFTIAGNHETKDQEAVYQAAFTLPMNGEAGGSPSGTEEYYSFNHGNIHVVGLTVENGVSISGPQLAWLQNDLAGNHSDWLIAFMHRPMHSAGYHKTDGDATALAMKGNWLPALEAAGVDLVLAGHNHVYERTYLLDNLLGNSTTITGANKIDTGLGRVDVDGAYQKIKGQPHQGTMFINCEAGGTSNKASYLTTPFSFTPVVFAADTYEGSLVIDVEGSSRMDVKFLCDEMSLQGSHVWDYFTILKTEGPDAVDDDAMGVPLALSVSNYPNPFNPVTVIRYSVPPAIGRGGIPVKLVVYDVLGRQVAELVNESKAAGSYEVTFPATGLSSGTYVCQLRAGPLTTSTKLALVR